MEKNELQTRYVVADLKKLESFGNDGTFGCAFISKNLQIILADVQYVEFKNLKIHNIDD